VPLWSRKQGDIETSRVAFNPGGDLVVSVGDDQTARLWSTETGEPQGKPIPHDGPVYEGSFDGDNRLLTVGASGSRDQDLQVRAWDVATHEAVSNLRRINPEPTLVALAATPNCSTMLAVESPTSGDPRIVAREWRVDSGEPLSGVVPLDPGPSG